MLFFAHVSTTRVSKLSVLFVITLLGGNGGGTGVRDRLDGGCVIVDVVADVGVGSDVVADVSVGGVNFVDVDDNVDEDEVNVNDEDIDADEND
jgi:hypothetical protein